MPTIEQITARLQRLKQNLPAILGAEVVEFAVDNIRKEKQANGRPMTPRKTQNRSDQRNSARRGLLIDTGQGLRSIQVSRAMKGLVQISMEEYMGAHNTGATINHPGGTDFFYNGEKTVFVSKRKAQQLKAARKARLRKTRPHTITLPPRPFLAKSRRMDERLSRQVVQELKKVFR